MVQRAWKKIYDGIGGCIEELVDQYFEKYARYIHKAAPHEVLDLDGERVYQSFSKTAKSAGAMDGWSPEELAPVEGSLPLHHRNIPTF